MKTDRLTLLISPQDKAAIAARAAALHMPVSELIRRAALDYDPEGAAHLEELRALLPELNALADTIEARRSRWDEEARAREARWATLQSQAYRDKVRADLLADDSLDWPALRRLFGAQPAGAAA